MPPHLLFAFAVSFILHGAVFLPDFVARRKAPPPAPLQAELRLPMPPAPAEPLLKNTLDDEARRSETPPPPPPSRSTPPAATPRPAVKPAAPAREIQAAQRKLAKHIFYPPEAVARGIEGEVRLILKLADDGGVTDVVLAASSGHPILDNAAIKAAYAMGTLTGASGRELIIPVYFRLQ